MFKFAVSFFAIIAFAAAKPGLLAAVPLAYSSPLVAAQFAVAPAVVGHAAYVAPYASSYSAHSIAHSAAFPAAYAAAPVAVAAPLAAAPLVAPFAAHAHIATPFAAPWVLK